MTSLLGLILAAAVFYAATMILMKYWSIAPPMLMMIAIAGLFALGAWCEIEALKLERLSITYIAILGAEAMIIALVSFAYLGESLSLREAFGGVMILAGLAVVASA